MILYDSYDDIVAIHIVRFAGYENGNVISNKITELVQRNVDTKTFLNDFMDCLSDNESDFKKF